VIAVWIAPEPLRSAVIAETPVRWARHAAINRFRGECFKLNADVAKKDCGRHSATSVIVMRKSSRFAGSDFGATRLPCSPDRAILA